MVFDKTGTLTQGKISVSEIKLVDKKKWNKEELFYYAGSAEQGSEHPIAKAVIQHAQEELGCSLTTPTEFEALPGCGISCSVDDHLVFVGSPQWLMEELEHFPSGLSDQIEAWEREAKTVVGVAVDGELVGLIGTRDELKPESKGVIEALNKAGITTWMLSGDNRRTATAIASKLGIPLTNVIAEATPATKAQHVKFLQQQSQGVVAMVGDGINDSVALATADVGIAVGAGTDVALEAADVILVQDNLHQLLVMLDISKKTFRRIKLNFWWAFLYNFFAMPLSAGILYPLFGIAVPPSIAGFSEILSSLPVIFFSLLLKRYSPPKHQTLDVKETLVMEFTPLEQLNADEVLSVDDDDQLLPQNNDLEFSEDDDKLPFLQTQKKEKTKIPKRKKKQETEAEVLLIEDTDYDEKTNNSNKKKFRRLDSFEEANVVLLEDDEPTYPSIHNNFYHKVKTALHPKPHFLG